MKISEMYNKYSKILNVNFVDNPRLETEILIRFILNLDKKDFLLKKDSENITENDINKLESLIKKRLTGKSIAEITESKYFFDMEFYVNKNVLIPRPETELIIEITLKKFSVNSKINILDIGTGSGIISIILSNFFPDSIIDSIDISKEAIEVAKINIEKNTKYKENINLINIDFFNFKPDKQYDLIVSNPPYIPEEEVKKIINDKIVSDPFISLNGGKDGLDFYRQINSFSQKFLKINGKIIIEHGINQRHKIIKLFSNNKFEIEFFNDLNNIDRVILFKKIV